MSRTKRLWSWPVLSKLQASNNSIKTQEPSIIEAIKREVTPAHTLPPPTPPPVYSIWDHRIAIGQPDYRGQYEIHVYGDSAPWTLFAMYDTVFELRIVEEETNEVPAIWTKSVDMGFRVEVTQQTIDYLYDLQSFLVVEQISPR